MILDSKDYKIYEIYSQLATKKLINGKDMITVLEEEVFKQQIDFSRIAFKPYRDQLTSCHQGYALETHDGLVELSTEKDFLRRMYCINRLDEEGSIDGSIGRIVDYDVPIKRCEEGKSSDINIGTIDLITETMDKVYLIETVLVDSEDRLLRPVLEIITYENMISRSKLIDNYRYGVVNKFENYHSKKDIVPSVMLYKGTKAYEDYKALKENSLLGMLIRKYNVKFFIINQDTSYTKFEVS